jgi:hypothetical protein
MCGIRTKRESKLDAHFNIRPSFLCHVDVPRAFVGRKFIDLFQEFALNHGVLPIALYRQADPDGLKNEHPFVYTNPLNSLKLRLTDLVFVLTPYGS